MQAALSAGLGITCLNASAIPDGIIPWDGPCALPPLPDVGFSLFSASRQETKWVNEVRRRLAEHLA